jgi:hypothetical protein
MRMKEFVANYETEIVGSDDLVVCVASAVEPKSFIKHKQAIRGFRDFQRFLEAVVEGGD